MKKSAFFGYCRTSTESQKDEQTIQIQIEHLKKYAGQNNLEITNWFLDDGVSGSLEHRPELVRMMKCLKDSPDVVGILIYKLDRLARDLYLQELILRELGKLNKKLFSVLEPNLNDDDPFRTVFRQVLGAFSQFEKSMIVLRLKSGKRRKAESGGFHGGFVYGYRSKNGKLEVFEPEASTVKEIFNLKKRKRMNLTHIANYLNDQGIKTRLRGHWHPSTVRSILKNPIYHGRLRFGQKEYLGIHEKLL